MKKVCLSVAFLIFALSAVAGNTHTRFGLASYYNESSHKRRTACGERYCKDSFTAASKTLKFGTYLKVTNTQNHKMVIVRVNDRGPHRKHRIIDLSWAAARNLGMLKSGLARVEIEPATSDEIANRDNYNTDTPSNVSATKAASDDIATPEPDRKRFMIQAGIFSLKHNAYNLKAYLDSRKTSGVIIKSVSFRGQKCYRVTIGPINTIEKETALKLLRNKHIVGLVSKVKTKKKKHSAASKHD